MHLLMPINIKKAHNANQKIVKVTTIFLSGHMWIGKSYGHS
jgi:hypothetical protein